MTAYIDNNSQAARIFFKVVSNYISNAKSWDAIISYDIKPDEKYDATLISRRVYGNPHEFLAVMACAGISSFDSPIEQGVLILPNLGQLEQLKRIADFESSHHYRKNGQPRWSKKS